LKLRPYQQDAIDATARSLAEYSRVVLTAATASGKSILIAHIVKRFLSKSPDSRVLILCHQQEILEQNEEKLKSLGIECGVFCAGLKRKESKQVTLASRDSAGSKNSSVLKQQCALVLVDECHLVSEVKTSRYQIIFDAVKPKWIVGLTGSPFRLDGGKIFGDKKFWQHEACRISVADLQAQGFLSEHIFPRIEPIIDTSKLRSLHGDFRIDDLERASSTPEIVRTCLQQWNAYAADRKVTLFFCVSVAHAELVMSQLRSDYTEDCAILTGETDSKSRKQILTDAKSGKLKAIVNVSVLSTGIDIPVIDCIVFLRATQSSSLFIQMSGRGLRIHAEKPNCLFLDFAGNWIRFCGLDDPLIPALSASVNYAKTDDFKRIIAALGIPESATPFESPKKECPACQELVHAGKKKCPECGHIFITHSNILMGQQSKIAHLESQGWTVGEMKFPVFKQFFRADGKLMFRVVFTIGLKAFAVMFFSQFEFINLKKRVEKNDTTLVAARKDGKYDKMQIVD